METINTRLKILRKENLKLTTREFSAVINMTCGSITNMENGKRNITPRTINDICRAFNVRREWLVDGTGPIFESTASVANPETVVSTPPASVEDSIKRILSPHDVHPEVEKLMEQYVKLNKSDRKLIRKMISALLKNVQDPGDE